MLPPVVVAGIELPLHRQRASPGERGTSRDCIAALSLHRRTLGFSPSVPLTLVNPSLLIVIIGPRDAGFLPCSITLWALSFFERFLTCAQNMDSARGVHPLQCFSLNAIAAVPSSSQRSRGARRQDSPNRTCAALHKMAKTWPSITSPRTCKSWRESEPCPRQNGNSKC